ncbi:AraC-like DNA-binding protein [Larkinella arboricola]|uniref:AraC-like DNA-binding protein n=1 Tax=Larkinella arboricola TaxID=643671 RepID=A0A327WQB8_LARAB|nr:AraC-like DNA-binding protein [Larkinella arboricola]
MEFKTNYITPDIKLSVFEDKLFKTEVLFEHHLLVWFISGETKIIQAGTSYLFTAGDIFLIPRNQVVTIINYPKNGLPHKAVAMHLTVDRLRNYYAKLPVKPVAYVTDKVYQFKNHPLLHSCLASLVPYFDMQEDFPEEIASMKILEAITILRTIDKDVDGILANFDTPGKIDLVKFMESHFMYNLPLEKFGYMTGRSLSTFNRDFRKTFSATPQKWLTQKRLEFAHYQIAEHKKKPVEVYLEAGFEDLSHFSFAFKKHFGYIPTTLVKAR